MEGGLFGYSMFLYWGILYFCIGGDIVFLYWGVCFVCMGCFCIKGIESGQLAPMEIENVHDSVSENVHESVSGKLHSNNISVNFGGLSTESQL